MSPENLITINFSYLTFSSFVTISHINDSQNHVGLDKSNGKKPEHTKTINNVRNNSENPQVDRTNNGAKANKDSVIIVGDSMI